MESGEKDIVGHLKRLIENLARQLPDSSKAIECLWKFAKMHDRRCYQLIRFCMKPETDYRNVVKAIVSAHIWSHQGYLVDRITERVHKED